MIFTLCIPFLIFQIFNKKNVFKYQAALPWWLSGKESACQCRRHGFKPWSGKIPHAAERLNSSTTTTESVLGVGEPRPGKSPTSSEEQIN